MKSRQKHQLLRESGIRLIEAAKMSDPRLTISEYYLVPKG